jgi:tetratricopeptide (TPR) repeat protein
MLLAGCRLSPNDGQASTPNGGDQSGAVLLPLSPEPAFTPTGVYSAKELIALGEAAFEEGEMDQASRYYDQAITVDSNNAEAYQKRGEVFAATGSPDLAIANYSHAMSLKIDYTEAYFSRGRVYLDMANYELARLDFSEAITFEATFAEAYKFRAMAESGLGLVGVAMIDFEVYLALRPDAADREQVFVWMDELKGARLRAISPDGSVFFDDFLDDESGWIGGASAPGYGAYNSDGYRIITTIAKSVIWARPTLWLQDVRIEVDTEKGDGTDDNFFGVICRYQSSQNFYALIISSDGHYGIARRVDGGGFELIGLAEMPFSDAINQGDESNRIVAECVGDVLRLTVNGHMLLEMRAEDFIAGDVGIIVGTFDEPRTNILFDNFAVFEVAR